MCGPVDIMLPAAAVVNGQYYLLLLLDLLCRAFSLSGTPEAEELHQAKLEDEQNMQVLKETFEQLRKTQLENLIQAGQKVRKSYARLGGVRS